MPGTRDNTEERWIFGIHAVERRLRVRPSSIRQIVLLRSEHPRLGEIEALARAARVPTSRADGARLRELTGTGRHQGIAACTGPFEYQSFPDILKQRVGPGLVLDRIQDPQNFGAIIRTAAATGIAYILIPRHGAVDVTAVVEKVASGAACDVSVCLVANVARALEEFRKRGVWTIGLVPRGGENLLRMQIPDPVVLVIGGEQGLRPLVQKRCDLTASIPMRAEAESLNASVAAAVAMYELFRRTE